jgi:phospholipid transport system transporter-binding protein
MTASAATVHRDGDRLVLSGTLDRTAATVLWPRADAVLGNARVLDVASVASVDSAGLALLVALAERMHGAGVEGAPPGLAELLAAYRLTPTLAFDAGG